MEDEDEEDVLELLDELSDDVGKEVKDSAAKEESITNGSELELELELVLELEEEEEEDEGEVELDGIGELESQGLGPSVDGEVGLDEELVEEELDEDLVGFELGRLASLDVHGRVFWDDVELELRRLDDEELEDDGVEEDSAVGSDELLEVFQQESVIEKEEGQESSEIVRVLLELHEDEDDDLGHVLEVLDVGQV